MLPLDQRLEILTQHIIRARMHFDLWWFSVGEQSGPRIAETLEQYAEFFRFDVQAHFASMILHSSAVWDNRGDVISLPRLARDILDPSLFPVDRSTLDKVGELKSAAIGIQTIRHEAIAHRNEGHDYDALFRNAGVMPDRIPDMMAEWLDVTNRLRSIRGMPHSGFRDLPLAHYQKLIRHLGGSDVQPMSGLDDIPDHAGS
ncbi:MAG: hypothetical protein RIS17_1142 [Pseudomonadota bacterium]|jgi:hypothetical protein